MHHWKKFRLRVLAGSLAVVGVGTGVVLVVGSVGELEALDLLTALVPTARFYCSAIMTATATILALMVTLVSLSSNLSKELKPVHYRRIQNVALVDSLAFMGGLLLQFFIMIPIEDPEVLPYGWYRAIYYGILGWSALLGVFVASVVMMLYSVTKQIIRIVGLEAASPLSTDPDESESTQTEAVDEE